MAASADNLVLSIFGRKGSGKTTLARKVLQEFDRVIVFDTLGQYDGEECWTVEACLAAFERAAERPRFTISCRLADVNDYLDLFEVAFELPGVLLVFEEVSFYCSAYALPAELSTIVRYGRNRSIDQIYIARRPAEVHRDLTAQSDVIVSFVQHEPRDVAYLSAAAGEDVSRVRSLPAYRCAAWGNRAKLPLAVLAQLDRAGEQRKLKLDELDEKEDELAGPAEIADIEAIDPAEAGT